MIFGRGHICVTYSRATYMYSVPVFISMKFSHAVGHD